MSDKVIKLEVEFRHPPLATNKEMYAEPYPSDEMIWVVCPYLRNHRDCQRCPEHEQHDDYGPYTRGCRISAAEACRFASAAQKKYPTL